MWSLIKWTAWELNISWSIRETLCPSLSSSVRHSVNMEYDQPRKRREQTVQESVLSHNNTYDERERERRWGEASVPFSQPWEEDYTASLELLSAAPFQERKKKVWYCQKCFYESLSLTVQMNMYLEIWWNVWLLIFIYTICLLMHNVWEIILTLILKGCDICFVVSFLALVKCFYWYILNI